MNRTTLDLWVGIFVAIGIAALAFLALKVGNLSMASGNTATYTVTAKFDNIGGLKARASVKVAGVVVGRVAAIDFDSGSYQAVVKLTLNDNYKFPIDTGATINTAGLLGEQYVGLEVGGEAETLKDGSVIRTTQSAVVLEKLISQFMFSKAAETPKVAQ